MQFTFIVVVSAHVASVLLIGWMTVQLHRHLRRIEQRLTVLEHGPERVAVVARPAPPSMSTGRQSDTRFPDFPQGPRVDGAPHPDGRDVRGTRGAA